MLLRLSCLLISLYFCATCAAQSGESGGKGVAKDTAPAEFMAAMQRIRQRTPEPADSPALKAYVIYDYLIAARFRRDLELKPGDDLDKEIDDFLQAHSGQPVARNLRNDWLTSLANRRRWDWFLPRSTDVTSATLICDRMQGRI